MAGNNLLDAPPGRDEIAASLDGPPSKEEMANWKGPELQAVDRAGRAVMGAVGTVGRYSQSVIQNPVKASALEYQRSQDLGKAAGEGWKAFLNPDYEVPPTSEMLGKMGVPNDPAKGLDTGLVLNPWARDGRTLKVTPADVAGGVVDSALDPMTYVPGMIEGKAAKAGVEGMAGAASRLAEERAYKAATGQNIAAYRRAAKVSGRGGRDAEQAMGNIRGVGRQLLDNKAVGWASNPESIGKRAPGILQQAGDEIAQVGKAVDQAYPQGLVSGPHIATDLMDYAASLPPTPGNKALQDRIIKEAQVYDKMGQMTFDQAQDFKNSYKYKATDPGAFESSQDTINRVKGIIGQHMDDAAAQVPEGSGYAPAKAKYGAFAGISEAATDRTLKNQSNRFVSPSDYGAGLTGVLMASGKNAANLPTAIAGMAAAAANNQLRTRGSAFVARSLDVIAKGLRAYDKLPQPISKLLEQATQRGAESVIVTHNLLMNSDPEYRAHFEGQ